MPILPTDIHLLASERMTDTPDGGGRMTAAPIVSGQLSNIFPKVSRTDAVYGRVNLRKIYVAVRSATLDMYGGAHVMLADAPDDPHIGAVLFSTGSAFDTRATARDRIESYVVAGSLSRMRLYGDQIGGGKAILTYQRVEEPLPDVGDVLCLSVEAADRPAAQQYVRITDIAHEVRTFEDNATFTRRVLTLKLAGPLLQTYPGAEPVRTSTDSSPTRVRTTVVADASRYYGIQPVTDALPAGALTCQVASVYAPLVPATTRETPVSLAEIAGANLTRASATAPASVSLAGQIVRPDTALTLRLHHAAQPGSVTLAFGAAGYSGADDGAGGLIGQVQGHIDYAAGVITGLHSDGWQTSGTLTATYLPAVALGQPAHTRGTVISLATRGTVYVETLVPAPAPGTVVVDYRALGKWYRLHDNGHGVLGGDSPAIGTGSIDYATGACVVTLGALPDIDSAVLYAWGSPAHTTLRAGATSDAAGHAEIILQVPLEHLPVGATTLSLIIGGVPVSLASTGDLYPASHGVSGRIDQVSGVITLRFTDRLPDAGTDITLTLTSETGLAGVSLARLVSAVIAPGALAFTLEAPIKPGSARITLPVRGVAFPVTTTLGLKDDGSGGLILPAGKYAPHFAVATDLPAGSLDYATGAVTLLPAIALPYTYWDTPGAQWVTEMTAVEAAPAETAHLDYTADLPTVAMPVPAVAFPLDGRLDAGALTLALTTRTLDAVVPGSVLFTLSGSDYWDGEDGTLYTRTDPSSATRQAAGRIDYATGQCRLSLWQDNVPLGLAVRACLTTHGDFTALATAFRTAGSPLRPASTYIQVTAADGTPLSATADLNGIVTGVGITGRVDQTMGVVALLFAVPVLPGTLRYSAVVISSLPLDAALLGIDPVRLPIDGRVPIYRPGDIVVLHHTATTPLPDPAVAGQTYALGRTDLGDVRLADAHGTPVPDAQWSANRLAGTLTLAADATLTGLVQPLVASHRIEQMALATDVQISGAVSLSAPLPRAFPAGSLLSSALLCGDLAARVTAVFDQATWTGVWQDSLIGAPAAAQYDDAHHPIEVLNDGALTERWRISFTSASAFVVVGENSGQIASGTTLADLAVTDTLTARVSFIIRAAGWGAGWAIGNQLRFNTVGATAPLWIARTILGGAALTGDALTLEVRGDID